MILLTNNDSQRSELPAGVTSASADQQLPTSPASTPAALPNRSSSPAGLTDESHSVNRPQPPVAAPPARRARRWLLLAAGLAGLAAGVYFLMPWVSTALNTVSTDDAYVNGHVTFVAPRVSGQVSKVLVDDNMRVKKGDLLVELDKEPFQIQVSLKRDAVRVSEANLAAAESNARSQEATATKLRWKIQTAGQQVKNQIALLHAKVAALRTTQATLDRAQADFRRGEKLVEKGAMSREDFDRRRQDIRTAEATVNQALEEIFQVRAALGLSPRPEKDQDLTDVPSDIVETFSDVRAAFSELVQTMTQLGLPLAPMNATPSEAIAEFTRLPRDGNIDRIFQDLLPKVPAVMQARAQLEQARHDLEQAELNLRYCNVVSEIDGLVTSRNINPGNNVQAGQQLMAVRSVTDIWIDANFKETQLGELRIGQRVRCEIDMYGGRREFEGRITGFTAGTGQTLALLPPQNATGNFVKIVQRLPVRVELTDYDPEQAPLFAGLSVTPYVYYKEPPTGPNAGKMLQSLAELPTRQATTNPKDGIVLTGSDDNPGRAGHE